jgi:hypothetical protein
MPFVQPTCPKCDSHAFHLRDYDPPDHLYKISILCCSKCGAVVGTTGFKLTNHRIDRIFDLVERIAKAMRIIR